MKRFVVKISIIVLISVSMMNIVFLSEKDEWSLHSHERNAILAYTRLKTLKDTNKIVIIAGSNGGFSINSRMISKAFHIPVVNTSTHAGIGVRMQFEIYKELLHEGDIVIFCPEYGSDKKRLYGELTLFRILSTYMPFAYSKISIPQWLFIYKNIGAHYNETLEHRGAKAFDGPYSVNALNEYGDIECERLHQDSIKTYDIKGKMDNNLISYYKYMHSYTQERGVKFIFLPPTFIESNYIKNNKQIDSIANTLKVNGVGYQASPKRYAFPDSLYFDTPYHMTQSGANKRTEKIIEDLHRLLLLTR